MSRLFISTRGIGSWRARLKDPDRQWRRRKSAFETAVSWELASSHISGVPDPILALFPGTIYANPQLLLAVAEHKVELPGGNAASQCDVWAILKTDAGMLSLTVEAKANETFGDKTLEQWLISGMTNDAEANRRQRWHYIREHLPASELFAPVRYQMLHRCAASVMEARRFGFEHAVFVVQAFNAPDASFGEYEVFCRALHIPAARGRLATTSVGGISLSVGWVDCPFASDREVADTV